jgi:hypothetical protein
MNKWQSCPACNRSFLSEWNHNKDCAIIKAQSEAYRHGCVHVLKPHGEWMKAVGITPCLYLPASLKDAKKRERMGNGLTRLVLEEEVVFGYYAPAWAKRIARWDRGLPRPSDRRKALAVFSPMTETERFASWELLQASYTLSPLRGAVMLVRDWFKKLPKPKKAPKVEPPALDEECPF